MAGPFQGMIRHLGAGNTPTWSPDDSQIAYMVAADGNSELKLLEGTKSARSIAAWNGPPTARRLFFRANAEEELTAAGVASKNPECFPSPECLSQLELRVHIVVTSRSIGTATRRVHTTDLLWQRHIAFRPKHVLQFLVCRTEVVRVISKACMGRANRSCGDSSLDGSRRKPQPNRDCGRPRFILR